MLNVINFSKSFFPKFYEYKEIEPWIWKEKKEFNFIYLFILIFEHVIMC